MVPETLPLDSFFICNTESSKRPGSHWVIVAKKNGIVYFGDALVNDPMFYRNIVFKHFDALRNLNRLELQKEPLCGVYCIYFAFFCSQIFTFTVLIVNSSYVSLQRDS